mgnify:CR=1 FL=1
MTYQNNMPVAETPQEQEAIDRFFQNLGSATCPQVEAARQEVQRHFDTLDADDRAGDAEAASDHDGEQLRSHKARLCCLVALRMYASRSHSIGTVLPAEGRVVASDATSSVAGLGR